MATTITALLDEVEAIDDRFGLSAEELRPYREQVPHRPMGSGDPEESEDGEQWCVTCDTKDIDCESCDVMDISCITCDEKDTEPICTPGIGAGDMPCGAHDI